jgi:hypothetical protein
VCMYKRSVVYNLKDVSLYETFLSTPNCHFHSHYIMLLDLTNAEHESCESKQPLHDTFQYSSLTLTHICKKLVVECLLYSEQLEFWMVMKNGLSGSSNGDLQMQLYVI